MTIFYDMHVCVCVHCDQNKEFGWRVYKAIRNRTDAIQRFFPVAFKNTFFHRDAGGGIVVSPVACELLKHFGIKRGEP